MRPRSPFGLAAGLLIGMIALSACSQLANVFGLSTPTPVPTLTPTPAPALPPDHVWIVIEGLEREIFAVSPSGAVLEVDLPLNAGQRAPEVVASRDGQTLAYQVWSDDGAQHGIAAWNLLEPNARLVTGPLANYRIIHIALPPNSPTIYYTQVEDGVAPAEADWRLEAVPLTGGQSVLVANREMHPGLLPPRPVGMLADGRILLHAATRSLEESGEVLQGVFTLDLAGGTLSLIGLPEDRVVSEAVLSPDGTRLLAVTYQGPLPGQAGSETSISIARVLDLAGGAPITLTAPDGASIVGARWYDDGRLLLDVVPSVAGGGRSAHRWALAEIGAEIPWRETSPDPAREALFTYEPYLGGVVYTVFPATTDTDWRIFFLSDIATDSPAQSVSLGAIRPGGGAPRIIYAP